MADEKLPKRIETPALPEASQSTSFLGRITSRLRSRLNTKAMQDSAAEAAAYRLYLEELERLPEATLKKERAVEHYLRHRDALIENDHQEHQRQMDKESARRKIEAEDDRHKIQIARLKRQKELAKAQREAAQSQWGLDAFKVSVPFRKQRVEHIFRQGTTEAATHMMKALKELTDESEEKETPTASRAQKLEDELATIEGLIDELLGTEPPEVMQRLKIKRAQLKSWIDEEKNRPS